VTTIDMPTSDLDGAANVDAERVVLGAMLLDRSVIGTVAHKLTPQSFYRPEHVSLCRVIFDAADAGDPTDPVAIMSRFAGLTPPWTGGAAYLVELVQAVPMSVSVGWYADRVAEAEFARNVDRLSAHAKHYARTLALSNPREALARLQSELDELATAPTDGDPVRWSSLAGPGLDSIEAAGRPGGTEERVRTGYVDLDRLLGGGFRAGQLITVAGRTGMGKSVGARGFAAAAAFGQKLPTVFFTLEMTAVEVFGGLLSSQLRIPLDRINTGELDDNEWTRVARFLGETEDTPLWVDDTPGIGLPEIRSKSLAIKKRHGLGLVVVDYLQLVDAPTKENRQVAVSGLAGGFKVLAGVLGCPVIMCAQLNRGPTQRTNKRPELSDLRESGSIEDSSNIVILIHRDDYYDKESPRAGEADLIVAKNRGGATDTITVAAQLHLSRFVDMAIV
jgi:replicative DNA helicase